MALAASSSSSAILGSVGSHDLNGIFFLPFSSPFITVVFMSWVFQLSVESIPTL